MPIVTVFPLSSIHPLFNIDLLLIQLLLCFSSKSTLRFWSHHIYPYRVKGDILTELYDRDFMNNKLWGLS